MASTPMIASTDRDDTSSSVSVDEIGADGPLKNSNDESPPPRMILRMHNLRLCRDPGRRNVSRLSVTV